jgi:hypothetical protein
VLGSALLIGALATGCADSGPGNGTTVGARDAGMARTATLAQSPSPSPSPVPSATSPADLCARIVAHWSREVLDQNAYGDYQSMGLSNGQYAILMDVVDAARAERKHRGPRSADELIDRQARERCAQRHRDGDPTGGPWS